eukprot:TRINITY_DN4169_c0_g1_i1.p1 TRINITY_DN4169_c0_g1~~TRINITY_DN4169_c0_g1_i1.p1  ORF type:complete len:554 (-),score=85.66 TRINITY_DN4169_c0_g1_i1:26-1651(-)
MYRCLSKFTQKFRVPRLKPHQKRTALLKKHYTTFKLLTLRERTPISKLLHVDQALNFVGSTVAVAGWIRTTRVQGGGTFAFIEVNDGTCQRSLQVIVDNETIKNSSEIADLNSVPKTGASIFVQGTIIKSLGKGQLIELKASNLKVLGECEPSIYPLAKQRQPLEHLRNYGHLRSRTSTISAMIRVRNQLARATHDFFQNRGFYNIQTPIITSSDCEGAGEMFHVTTLFSKSSKKSGTLGPTSSTPSTVSGEPNFSHDFFKKPVYLTVSGQLDAEIYACSMSNVYTFGPTFRAEESHTTRHLAEFWMVEPEVAFADLHEVMEIAEDYVKASITSVLEKCSDELEHLSKVESFNSKSSRRKESNAGWWSKSIAERLKSVSDHKFSKISYTEAISLLTQSNKQFEVKPEWGVDLNSEHETYLTEAVSNLPVIVYDYPGKFKPFYMRTNGDKKTVAAFDLLVPGIGELIGGGQREERLDVLETRIRDLNLDLTLYDWYLDLRRFGSVPHSGFGLGFERLVSFATGLENIRDAIPFPRYPGHASY